MALALGREEDVRQFQREAQRVKAQINQLLFDTKRGIYRDGLEGEHASLHANMFPLAFGLVTDRATSSVVEFIRSRGMACSVYGAQFLLDALYQAGEDDYALSLLASTGVRGWYDMIRAGSTITLEAWGKRFKPNLDWNHAWGASPANIIPRKLVGVEPLEPGFRKIAITPQIGNLDWLEAVIPTIRGAVSVAYSQKEQDVFVMQIELPANSEGCISLPPMLRHQKIYVDGERWKGAVSQKGERKQLWIGSGQHIIELK